jgi:hypothetical protein
MLRHDAVFTPEGRSMQQHRPDVPLIDRIKITAEWLLGDPADGEGAGA